MGFISETLSSVVATSVLLGVVGYVGRTWIKARLSGAIRHEYAKDLEQLKIQLQATAQEKIERTKADLAASNSREIETLKARLSAEYEVMKASLVRYFQKQFDLYNDLWVSLCDLEGSVRKLWDIASPKNLRVFVKQIEETRSKVRKSALLIEDHHYRELNEILDVFDRFQVGKRTLIELRQDRQGGGVAEDEIRRTINSNSEAKNNLVELLDAMMTCLKRQIVQAERLNNSLQTDVPQAPRR